MQHNSKCCQILLPPTQLLLSRHSCNKTPGVMIQLKDLADLKAPQQCMCSTDATAKANEGHLACLSKNFIQINVGAKFTSGIAPTPSQQASTQSNTGMIWIVHTHRWLTHATSEVTSDPHFATFQEKKRIHTNASTTVTRALTPEP
jgi:hypothetical protein